MRGELWFDRGGGAGHAKICPWRISFVTKPFCVLQSPQLSASARALSSQQLSEVLVASWFTSLSAMLLRSLSCAVRGFAS